MKTVFLGITWAALHNSIVLPLLFVAVVLLVWRFRRVQKAIALLAKSVRAPLLFQNVSVARHGIKAVLLSIGLFFLFFALLRPQWDKKKQIVEQMGRDLFIAFDISRSMLVEDCKPNRLDCAKAKVHSLLNRLECERVGLILFSGSTCVQCPLTSDFSAFFMFLDQLDVETMSSGTTAIDQAIKKTLSMFKSMPIRKNKLLVLLTDGEDFSSNLVGVRKEAVKEGLTIFAIGVGTPEGGPIPIFKPNGDRDGYQKDRSGNVIISRLNEGILHNLAKQTGGNYLRLAEDNKDIDVLVRCVQKFEKERFNDKKVFTLQEKYPYFLAVSLVCFALEWLL